MYTYLGFTSTTISDCQSLLSNGKNKTVIIGDAASSSITHSVYRVVISYADRCFAASNGEVFPLNSLQSQLFRQLLPLAVDQGFGLGVHQDFIRPGTREAFARPLAGSVNAHLRAVIWQAGSVVERINRPQRELDVALGIDVVEHFQRDIGYVLHVDVFIHDDDAFREHRLAERPDGVHHFARLTRV